MIIVRSPLRISLGGGGTDLASYYRDHEGFLIAAAIDKYVYVSLIKPFQPGIYLKYSEIEHVDAVDQVRHRIVREALKLFPGVAEQIEITTLADIPAGTGLGNYTRVELLSQTTEEEVPAEVVAEVTADVAADTAEDEDDTVAEAG